MKLPPQVAAVPRPGAGGLSPPARAGIDPLAAVKNDHLLGHPNTDYVEGVKGRVERLYCGKGNRRWSYCPNSKSYACCPNNKKCDDSSGTVTCA